MQPTDENVPLNTAWKIEVTQRDVTYVAIQISTALAGDPRRHFIEKCQHHGNVMWRKAPKNILLCAYFPDIQAVGIQVVNLSECPVLNQFLQFQDSRMISEDVSDHEDSALRRGQFHKVLALLHINGQWLLD